MILLVKIKNLVNYNAMENLMLNLKESNLRNYLYNQKIVGV